MDAFAQAEPSVRRTWTRSPSDWKIAQAGVARTDAALVEGRKQLIAAETNLAYRKALLGDTEIVAPFDGLIVQRQRDPGDIAVPGSAVLSLISTKELWITAWVDETEMSRVADRAACAGRVSL